MALVPAMPVLSIHWIWFTWRSDQMTANIIEWMHVMAQGLDHVIVVVASGKQLLFRQYSIAFKKSGAQVPRTELAEVGPRFDFSVRRSRAAPDEIQTQSMKQPKVEKKKVRFHESSAVASTCEHKEPWLLC